jgi:hypothetical protein
MPSKIAFYPCCNRDIIEPLSLLRDLVDEVVFCDIDRRLVPYWEGAATKAKEKLPQPRFMVEDARVAVRELERIDVLFYRRDSEGEGGSGVYVLSQWFLPSVLEKMPSDGGLIISDGSNSRRGLFRKMKRDSGVRRFNWYFRPIEEQSLLDLYGLWVILATPNMESNR